MGWIETRIKEINRRFAPIFYDPHYFAREAERNLDVDLVEMTVRMGTPIVRKCTFPDRICFRIYFGKTNETYEVPVKIHKNYLEVKSAWKRKGRI